MPTRVIDYVAIENQKLNNELVTGIARGEFGATVFGSSVFNEASVNPQVKPEVLAQARSVNNTIGTAFGDKQNQQAASLAYQQLFPVMAAPPPPVQARQDTPSSNTIPAPVTPSVPVQARQQTTLFSSAKPLIIFGIVIFSAVTILLPPRTSKKKR